MEQRNNVVSIKGYLEERVIKKGDKMGMDDMYEEIIGNIEDWDEVDDLLKKAYQSVIIKDELEDDDTQNHVFSDKYLKNKEKIIKNVGGQRVISNIVKKVVIASIALIVTISTSVVAAAKIKQIYAVKEGYKTAVSVKWDVPKEKYTGNIGVDVNYLPEGMVEIEKNYKYGYSDSNDAEIVLSWYRVDTEEEYDIKNSLRIEELMINENNGYYIEMNKDFNRVLLYFSDCNVVLQAYINSEVQRDDVMSILKNIDIYKTEEEIQAFSNWSILINDINVCDSETSVGVDYIDKDNVYSVGDEVKIDYKYIKDAISVTVNEVSVLDSVEGMDKECFLNDMYDKLFDSEGKIKDKNDISIINADGINDTYEKIDFGNKKTKIIYIKMIINNNTMEILDKVNINYRLKLFIVNYDKDGEKYIEDDTGKIIENMNLPIYIDNQHEKKNFTIMNVNESEEKEISMAYIVEEESINELFLDLKCDDSSNKNNLLIDIRQ